MTKSKDKKVYAYEVYGSFSETFDTVDEMLKELSDQDDDPEACTFYELTPGVYVPPSTPATVRF